jgi:4-amino-4-deoxy-L-arabinose transferase-like glycosyltransferase
MDESFNQGAVNSGVLVFEPRAAFARAREWARRRAYALGCAALLSAMTLQMFAAISRKSITVDEIVLIPAAYYHWAAGNCQLVHEHPPLAKLVAGLPLLLVQPNEAKPETFGVAPNSPAGKWKYEESFWEGNFALFDSLSFWGRLPMLALSIATGVLLFFFARDLFGPRAALLTVALFSIEPTVLAHGRVVQTDMAASFGYLLVFHTLQRYLRAPSARRALLVGLAGGVACTAKFSMLIVAPVVGFVLLAQLWRASRDGKSQAAVAAHALLVALAAVLFINATYFFDHRPLNAEDVQWAQGAFPSGYQSVLANVNALSYILPTDFVLGIFWQVWHNGVGHNAGLLGMYSPTGWWYYFPVAFALKTTLPFLLLSLASLAWGAYELWRRRDWRFLYVLAPFAVYSAFVLMSRIDIGVRYLLPAYMFLFVACGALLERMARSVKARRVGLVVAVALVGWMCVEAARAFPDHTSYMNQLASARPHWWYLSDSNVEWGDDVRALAAYLRERGETSVRGGFLGGFIVLHHYGVGYDDALAPHPEGSPRPRYTAVGASFLNGSTVPFHERDGRTVTEVERVNTFDEYRRRTPEKIFGGSIYLFREY